MNKRPDLKINNVVPIKSGSSKNSRGGVPPVSKEFTSRSPGTPFIFARVTNVVYPQEFLPRGDELAVL